MQGIDPRVDVVCGRKHCTKCRRWRHAIDFHPARRAVDETVLHLRTRCKTCEGIMSRARAGTKRRYGQRAPLTNAERLERRRERMRKNPILLARHREYQRIWSTLKRRKEGRPEQKKKRKVKDDATGYSPYAKGPIVEAHFFIEWLERQRLDMEINRATLAALLKVDNSLLDRMYTANYVHIGTIDEYAARLGHPEVIHTLYGDV